MRKTVVFDIPAGQPVQLINGDVVKADNVYRYPLKMLEREPTPWHVLGRDQSQIGTRLHRMLSVLGLSPVRGCRCRSIATRLDGHTVEWNELNIDGTTRSICQSLQAHRNVSLRTIVQQLFGCGVSICLKLLPTAILPWLVRRLVRTAIRMEKRRV